MTDPSPFLRVLCRAAEPQAGGDQMPGVLVADDDHDIRAALRMLLEDAGYAVIEAEDGVATFDIMLISPTPLVVLLDVLMPGISGYEVLLRVASDPLLSARHAYIVVTAAQLTDVRVGHGFSQLVTQLGALVVSKPFDIDEVLRRVNQQRQRLAVANPPAAPGGEAKTS